MTCVSGAGRCQVDFARFIMAAYSMCILEAHDFLGHFLRVFLNKIDSDVYM
jgi:hypothetical protein